MVTDLPSTARLVTVVSSAVAMTVPTREITKTTVELSRASLMARLSSLRVALGSLRASVLESSRTRPWNRTTMISVSTATVREMPRTVRQ
ncbi:hypothetical protein GCM10011428_42920 [Streptomyces violaceus]